MEATKFAVTVWHYQFNSNIDEIVCMFAAGALLTTVALILLNLAYPQCYT